MPCFMVVLYIENNETNNESLSIIKEGSLKQNLVFSYVCDLKTICFRDIIKKIHTTLTSAFNLKNNLKAYSLGRSLKNSCKPLTIPMKVDVRRQHRLQIIKCLKITIFALEIF